MRHTDDGHAGVVQLGLNSDVQNLSDDQNIHSQTEVMIKYILLYILMFYLKNIIIYGTVLIF